MKHRYEGNYQLAQKKSLFKTEVFSSVPVVIQSLTHAAGFLSPAISTIVSYPFVLLGLSMLQVENR